MPCPPVIALATFKGGSGKSTVAACLATYWRTQGRTPAIVDADPQESITRWYGSGEEAVPLKIVSPQPIGIRTTVERLKERYFPIIIDTAGFRNALTASAIAEAQMVLIPVKPSPMDVRVALETLAVVKDVDALAPAGADRTMVRFMLTMTTPGSVIARHVRQQMEARHLQLLASELCNRVSYAEAALSGATPTLTEPNGTAAREIARLAQEIETIYPIPAESRGG